MELRRPVLSDEETILSMMEEFEANQVSHDGGFWDSDAFDYAQWLQDNLLTEAGLDLAEGWVPSIQFVAFDKGRAIGFLNLRLRLNDQLREKGGHIGYSVRPSEQGKGYGTLMLAEGLVQAKTKNIPKVLVTCHKDNGPSRKVILNNGGVLEDVREDIERYWIGGCHE